MRNVLTAVFVALFVVSVGAQTQQPVTPSQQPATPAERPTTPGQQPTTRAEPPATTQAAKVMIAGCIQTASPAAPAAGATAAAAPAKFDLANAKVVSSGPVGTTGGAPTAMRYRLEGDEKTISSHLNQQVEITGTVSPATATGTAATTSAAPMMKVESLKMLAATCPPPDATTTPAR